jgi:hypothetical protein
MKKALASLVLALGVAAFQSAAQEAVFAQLSGKVEYQEPGAEWKAAKIGEKVKASTVVSTGFKSSAVLKIGQSSITLKPVTRLTLLELIKTAGGTQTELYLLSGRVRADVPPRAGQTTDFTVSSPTATASVRGTGFYFDGVNLLVDRGTVQLSTPTSQYRMVSVGEFSNVTKGNTVMPPIAVILPSTEAKAASDTEQSADSGDAELSTEVVEASEGTYSTVDGEAVATGESKGVESQPEDSEPAVEMTPDTATGTTDLAVGPNDSTLAEADSSPDGAAATASPVTAAAARPGPGGGANSSFGGGGIGSLILASAQQVVVFAHIQTMSIKMERPVLASIQSYEIHLTLK